MPDEQQPQNIEVDKSVIEKGKVKFMSKAGFFNPAPAKMKMIIKALVYFCTGLSGLVAGSTMFTGNQSKVIIFIITVFILALGAIELATGVQSAKEKE